MENYRKRIADSILERKLTTSGAVLIEGPKWCGKTTTAEQHARSILYMDDPDSITNNLVAADINPKQLLLGDKPKLIDEWQIAPQLWDTIRFEVDHRKGLGHFILTGSSTPIQEENGSIPENRKIRHSGTGRFSWLRMRPMSLYESGESNGTVSLGDLFGEKEKLLETSNLNKEELAYLVCRGGWPEAIDIKGDLALDMSHSYVEAIEKRDMSRADGIKRSPERVRRLLRSYARNQGTQATFETIAADMRANEANGMDVETVSSYIEALRKLFVVEESEAWNPNLRSKTAIRTTNTRYFTDPSIGTACLGIGPKDLLCDFNTFGLFFEALAIRDLRTYSESLLGGVYHYRDADGLECDAIIHLRNGDYGLVEIKIGGETLINEGVATLKKLSNKIDITKMKKPSFLMVLVGIGNTAYRRKEDGVYVVPIGCLKD
ncbi:MAG: ATP-binding protein [Bacteroidales bacterium]|nr:ATP-binding protein [Bacteroidales bacterium]